MASIVLGAIGSQLGGAYLGSFLGISGAAIGGAIGTGIGAIADSALIAAMQPGQRFEGTRLESLRVTSSTEGAVLPRVYGRMRVGGNVIWATDFREEVETERQGGKGGGPEVTSTTYTYFASFAVAVCEGPITGIGRIWADGKLMDMEGVTWRWYPGSETQNPDPFIVSKSGADATPAYRGVAYVVFEELLLEKFGNRLPQVSFEVFRPLADADVAEGLTRAVTVIPASGEFAYGTTVVRRSGDGDTLAENANADATMADFLVSLDRLQASAPNIESVSLVVSWFGDDLRAGECLVRPGVEVAEKGTTPYSWSVNGVGRSSAYLVSQVGGRPVYGGTPSDRSIVEAIQECKARGLRVTFYPFVLMDVPAGNTKPNPYSNGAASVGQPTFPWRGRITCSPASGFTGSVDKTAAAAGQVAALFGSATPAQFSVSGTSVSFTGPGGEWGLRRMILHYAHLCAAAGGVDAFLIGSEMRGLTQIRSGASAYPAVQQFRDLAADVRGILGAGAKISYAADWSEYFGHQPGDGTGDVFFHLDPLWADSNIDFVGIDNYMPLSDWRDGHEHLDAQAWPSIYDRGYLQSNIEGGEGFDWFYPSTAARDGQLREPITDGAAGKPWVFRYKDMRTWWQSQHFNRPGGVEAGSPTAWVPQSKPFWFTEFGCPAVDRGPNQPNVFFDPKSSESFVPYFSRGWRDDAVQRAYLEAVLGFWSAAGNNPVSTVYGQRMLRVQECAAWTWDARPYPFFPELEGVWADGENWRLGHWLTGRLGSASLQALVRDLCRQAGVPAELIDVSGLHGAVEGYAVTAIEAPRASIAVLARHFGFDAIETEGRLAFRMRGRAPVASVDVDALVAGEAGRSEPFELERGQETELPQALKWSVIRADGDYDPAVAEARRITVDTARIAAESFPLAVAPEEVERRARRALQEAWVGRETATFRLPPSRLALDPGDVVELQHDGRANPLRITSTADAEDRTISTMREDRAVYDLPPGSARPASISRPVVFGAPQAVFLDLPQLRADQQPHQPLIGAFARPWPGVQAVYRSPSNDGFTLLTTFGVQAQLGVTLWDLYSGPTSRFDLGNEFAVRLRSGSLASVTDLALFNGANVLAVESAPGIWEILQAGVAELIGPREYRLRRLLRGQRGTEEDMRPMVPAGARVVVLNNGLAALPVPQADLGIPTNWRVGPSRLPFTSDAYLSASFTPEGRGLQPFSVCHVEQPYLIGRVPGAYTIRWKRRSRDLAADSWSAFEVPLGEDSQAYEVDIMDGAAVKRTLSATTTSVNYSSANQIADWGANLAPGDSLTVRIAQVSPVKGRGPARTFTLFF